MDVHRRTALVTGSTDGHGRRVALGLAERGWRVLVHGRDAARGARVLQEIGDNGHALVLADLGSLADVRRLADDVLDRTGGALDLLVNNAGIASDDRRESADGVELTLAVNHLAHVALTEALLDGGARPARIVNVSSVSQVPFDWDDPLLERSYEGLRAYSQSKLAQVAYTLDLDERLRASGTTVDALHPATLMDTTMVRESFGRAQASVKEGAQATLRLIDDTAGSGRFFNGARETRAHPAAYDAGERERLRDLNARLLATA